MAREKLEAAALEIAPGVIHALNRHDNMPDYQPWGPSCPQNFTVTDEPEKDMLRVGHCCDLDILERFEDAAFHRGLEQGRTERCDTSSKGPYQLVSRQLMIQLIESKDAALERVAELEAQLAAVRGQIT